jgi:regulatory protein
MQKKKSYTRQQALPKIMAYCAYQERTQQEVRDKLYTLGLHKEDVEELIVYLSKENFIDETRFATSYSGGKFRIKKWGKIKILNGLKQEGLSDYNIKKAMAEIDDSEYEKTLIALLNKKNLLLKEPNEFLKKQKLARFAITKGYEPELVWKMIDKISFKEN